MALTTLEEMKSEILENLEQFKSTNYPQDLLSEFADSATPIYNKDIMQEWAELPVEHSDKWKEYGYDTQRNEGGIISLMRVDLVFYYIDLANRAWALIEQENMCPECGELSNDLRGAWCKDCEKGAN